MKRALVMAAVIFAVAGEARAEEARGRAEVEVKPSHILLGERGDRGGMMLQIGARHAFATGSWAEPFVGAQVGAFGIADDAERTVGVLAGPSGGVTARFAGAWRAGLSAAIDVGRIPVCNAWGMCLRYVGLFPAGTAEVSYHADKAVALRGSFSVRYVDTLAWTGASVEPALSGVVWW